MASSFTKFCHVQLLKVLTGKGTSANRPALYKNLPNTLAFCTMYGFMGPRIMMALTEGGKLLIFLNEGDKTCLPLQLHQFYFFFNT